MMRYCAIDIETTGLDPERCQVLGLACVVETDWSMPFDTLPTFRRLIDPGEIRGDAPALAMNARLIAELVECPGIRSDLGGHLIDLAGFLETHIGPGSVTIAGKNFGAFDFQFLRRCPQWSLIHHKHRFVDIGGMYWRPGADTCLPDLFECQTRAGLTPLRSHDAVSDCLAVIGCVRAFFARGDR